MIQCGARKGLPEARKVFQSFRDAGEKILVPLGQLLFWEDRYIGKQLEHFTIAPALYGPLSATRLHLHAFGLPPRGFVSISLTPLHSADGLPFAKTGSGWNSALLYAPVEGYNLGTTHFLRGGTFGYLMFKSLVLCVFFLHASTSLLVTLPSAKAFMRHDMRFKPRHSALRSFSSRRTFLSKER
jgi:hypothetical protein